MKISVRMGVGHYEIGVILDDTHMPRHTAHIREILALKRLVIQVGFEGL